MKIRLLLIALSVVLVVVFSAVEKSQGADPGDGPGGHKVTTPKLTLPGSGKMIIIITGKSSNAEVVGNKLYLIGADGKKSLAKDGTYKTTDGKTMRVKGGIIHPGSIRGWNPQPEPPAVYSPPADDDKSLNPPVDDQKSLKLR